ncbi:MAG: cytochrome d ubiquinol oxidase subunit II [Chloroflexota bacterium]
MSLADLWFALFILIVGAYLILDGFDLGVGILHLPLARTDDERRTMLASIGPVWDGNEVWLVVTGGVLFAVFPLVYASLFSGFYLAFMLVLLTLILRTVAIEFRSKEPGMRWRRSWDVVFAAASTGLALLLGIAFGNIVKGLPIDSAGNMQVTLVELLDPFALLFGVATVVMFAMQGALYLVVKTDGELQARVRAVVPRIMAAFVVVGLLVVGALVVQDRQVIRRFVHDIWPLVVPIAALATFAGAWRMHRAQRDLAAFACSSVTIGLVVIAGGLGMYPDLLISTVDPAYSLSTTNAASADGTLVVCLIVALIGIPFVLLYTSGVYYIFRGKARVEPEGY